MNTPLRRVLFAFAFFAFLLASGTALLHAQSGSNHGTILGHVTDPTGAVIPGARISILNPVSGFTRSAVSDGDGHYEFSNVPFDPYHLTVSAAGFNAFASDVEVRSAVPLNVTNALTVGGDSTVISVDAGDLIRNDTNLQTSIDRSAFAKIPLESQSSSLSSLVTLSSPGVAADSNGLFHGMGDHASNSFSIDGQPITDQQSKVFSNQLPSNSVQSMQVISGAPPAEFGGKTSLVIEVTTRSGMGITQPTGSITTSYGTFGSATGSFDLSYGGKNWGNFVEVDGLNTGRFLDPPEFTVFHDKGNEQNVFDRIDRQITQKDSIHLNLNYSRSWFQTPNSYDNLNVENVIAGGTTATPTLGDVGNTDQRSKIQTFDIAPTYTRVLSPEAVFNFGAFVRKDSYNYYPSGNPLADLGAPNVQSSSIAQQRSLTNAGLHTDLSYVKGINNIKIGGNYAQTFLRENDQLGIIYDMYNSPCVDANGNPLPGYSDPTQCGVNSANPGYNPVLAPYDLTRGGSEFAYNGHADVKEIALYLEDQIRVKQWLFNVGIRGDLYNGLAIARQAEPRVGLSYTVKQTNTVLRASYARTLETPFNENLVLSSQGCSNDVLSPLLACTSGVSGTLQPGFRNEFHAGLEQTFSKYLVVSGDYVWKYTHNAFDFSVLGNTPITFPIDWHNSKIPGYALRAEVPNVHNFSAYVVMSSVAARFFGPQVAGAGATVGVATPPFYPFRIDHDEKFNETTHLQYQIPTSQHFLPWLRTGPWAGFNWRYDSGLVAGSAPCYGTTDPNTPCGASSTTLDGQPAIAMVDATGAPLTADQEFQAGLSCNGQKATPYAALPNVCLASQFSSSLISIPAPNTGNNDKNPQRIAPRNLFDASIGEDNMFNGDRYKWSLRLTGVNLTNKYALYNFLSTFSGTHYVTPRALTAEIGFHF
jgi:Carboxypeptidase regulatory-like domain